MQRPHKTLFPRCRQVLPTAFEPLRGIGASAASPALLAALVCHVPATAIAANYALDSNQIVTGAAPSTSWPGGGPGASDTLQIGVTTSGVALTIESGGSLTTTTGFISSHSGKSGTVTVNGNGSTWTNTGHLFIGHAATGTLNILNGGTVSNNASAIGGIWDASGTVTVDGNGSTWTNADQLTIGRYGTGTLNILNGGEVTNTVGIIGDGPVASGTVTVNGSGSIWTNSGELTVGAVHTGILTIRNGGTVGNTDGHIGSQAGSDGTVTVTGSSSTWTNTGSLNVGDAGTGTLNILNGGKVTSTTGIIGNGSVASGTVAVDGGGSIWTNSGDLYVGKGHTGILTIRNGGTVSNTDGYIGSQAGSDGTVTVTGSGSTWTNTGSLNVGDAGTGILTIRNGGTVSNTEAHIGSQAGSDGTVTVTGNGSTWTNTGNLNVGDAGTGILNIQNGGTVSSSSGDIGHFSGSNGTVTITGAGSQWNNSNSLTIGTSGIAILNIKDGGTVRSSVTTMGMGGVGSSTLNLEGTNGARGVLETGQVYTDSSSAAINWNGGILRLTGDQFDLFEYFGAGSITLQGDGAWIDTQTHNVTISYLDVLTGSGGLTKLGSGTLTINSGNTYGGNTTVAAGTLKFNDYTQTAGQTLTIGVTSNTTYGKLAVTPLTVYDGTGTATFNAGARLAVDVARANTLAVGQTLSGVIVADTLNASTFKVTDNSALFNFEAAINGQAVDLNVLRGITAQNAVNTNGLISAGGAAGILDRQIDGTPSGDMADVVTALGQLATPQQVARAVAQTLPVNSGTQSIQGVLSSFGRVLSGRLGHGGRTGLPAGDALADRQIWAKPFGSQADQDDKHGVAGFSADSWGLAFGADAELTPGARLGVSYGYAKSNVNGNSGLAGTGQNADIDSHLLALYGSLPVAADLDLTFQADVGLNRHEDTRHLAFGNLQRKATADYKTYTAHVGAGLNKTLALTEATTLIPGLRADYTYLRSQSYTESGAGALNLDVDADTMEAFVLGADVRLLHRFSGRSSVNAIVGAGYDVLNQRGSIVSTYAGTPGQAFSTPGTDHSPWLLRAGLGYTYRTAGGTDIALRYDAEGRSDFLNQTASIRATWTF